MKAHRPIIWEPAMGVRRTIQSAGVAEAHNINLCTEAMRGKLWTATTCTCVIF
jgi:hypothetical protein